MSKNSTIVFVVGSSGVGKSTLASALAARLHYRLLSLDRVRDNHDGDTRKAWFEVWKAIGSGESVIVDATGASRIYRLVRRSCVLKFKETAVIKLWAEKSVLKKRLSRATLMSRVPISLAGASKVSNQYLADSVSTIRADLVINTTHDSVSKVLDKALHFLKPVPPLDQ